VVADEGCGLLDGQNGGRGKREEDVPKEITPMAWNMPSLMVQRRTLNVPRNSDGTVKPCVTTVTMITNMLINANVLAFDNYTFISLVLSFTIP